MRLYVHFSTTRRHGGSYQYEQNVLAALNNRFLPNCEIVFGYEDPSWKAQLPTNIRSFHMPRSKWFNYISRSAIIVGLPLGLLRHYFRLTNHLHRLLKHERIDVCFFPSPDCQYSYLVSQPAIGVIHDLMHHYELHFPEAASGLRRRYRDGHFRHMAHQAQSVLVDSKLGKNHVLSCYGPRCTQIHVLPFAIPRYADTDSEPDDFNVKFKLPKKFLFYPANLWRHKNHMALLKAIYSLRPELSDLQLVLSGSGGNARSAVFRQIDSLGLREQVHHLGYVEDKYMAGIYRRAQALVMPTYFGPTNIPPLEAMRHGCPVLVSDRYAMSEQIQDAGITFDPADPRSLADAIRLIWTDDTMVLKLKKAGIERERSYGLRGFQQCLLRILDICFSRLPNGDFG